jgi:RNA polymerase sigma-70 factor (ECF subfamily)
LINSEGRTELFEILYNRYYDKVRDKAYSFLKSRNQAGEFATDILARAYEKLKGFKGTATFSTWLYAITYNYCIDYLRVKKRIHYPEWSSQNELPEIIDEVEEDITELNYDKVLKILEIIHPEEKAILFMKYQDDFSIRDIGKALRITESAVKMRLKRARARVLYHFREQNREM